jgi:uncharacterized membrane protein YkoI
VNIGPAARTLAAMYSRLIATVLLIAHLAMVAHPAMSQNLVDPRSRERGHDHAKQTGGISMDQAVRKVESQYRARAVRVEEVNIGGRKVYEIRLLNAGGKVWTVRVDAETGQTS